MKRFSIIIPVYNVEKYIDQCINSVLNQSYSNFEVILIDDGSLDRSSDICDKYETLDKRVRTIHKENGGLSSARNKGLEVASGEYVIFLDSDDFWTNFDVLSDINSIIEKNHSDVILGFAEKYFEKDSTYEPLIKETYSLHDEKEYSKIDILKTLIETNLYRASAWNKIIKREIIEKNNMRFRNGFISEDVDWCGDLLINAYRFDVYNKFFYAYRQSREGSITSCASKKLILDKLFMCQKGLKELNQINDANMKYIVGSYYAYEYSVLIGLSENINDKDILRNIKDCKELLKYTLCKKVKKVAWLEKTIGYDLCRKVLCIFIKVKNR